MVLQATNAAGEQVRRSLVIETALLEPPAADDSPDSQRRRLPWQEKQQRRSPFTTPPQFD